MAIHRALILNVLLWLFIVKATQEVPDAPYDFAKESSFETVHFQINC
jgi:hypothetical protein